MSGELWAEWLAGDAEFGLSPAPAGGGFFDVGPAFGPEFQQQNPEFFGLPPQDTGLGGLSGFGGGTGGILSGVVEGLLLGVGGAAAPFLEAFVPPFNNFEPQLFGDVGQGTGFFVAGDTVRALPATREEFRAIARDDRLLRAEQLPAIAVQKAEAKAIKKQAKLDAKAAKQAAKLARKMAKQDARQARVLDRKSFRQIERPTARVENRTARRLVQQQQQTVRQDQRRDERTNRRALQAEDRASRRANRRNRRARRRGL